ncbi:hypothetical protein [Falsiroseomonas sp. HW251]|uniref:hypothetical protein n=1 Tax=Falsiroseomonas sp. HW251 TaxID=3390998 RepID=UPI003D31ED22
MLSATWPGRSGWAVASIQARCPSTVNPGGFRGGLGWTKDNVDIATPHRRL